MAIAFDWKSNDGIEGDGYSWNRSFSEPDLSANPKLSRFTIKHPHEYIAVDDLKFYRRRNQPVQLHTRSNICLYNRDEPLTPFGSLKSEYRKHFSCTTPSRPRSLLRRATSLRLEGLMQLLSEHQDKYHWFTAEDLKFSRTFPVRNPENLQLSSNNMKNSSYLAYPMLDSSSKILPREMFREEEQHKSHLQMRDQAAAREQQGPAPSEYKRQYVQQFPIEKAHSIPQMTSIKIQGEANFVAVPEYQDSFKMYANYSKSAPIKKDDNLRISGDQHERNVPEYRDKFVDPPKHMAKEKSLKTDDHLRPRGEFSKQIPEYYESFRDPKITEMPDKGKPREPFLRLRGKIEFNPEYRNNYVDFPRSRPVVNKPASTFRLPNANSHSHSMSNSDSVHSPPDQADPKVGSCPTIPASEVTATPEYRRAQYNYQIRERPTRENSDHRKSSDTTPPHQQLQQQHQQASYKRRPSRHVAHHAPPAPAATIFDDAAAAVGTKKTARYGRRASLLQNVNCRENSSIIEGNPKYAVGCRRGPKHNPTNENHQQGTGSFVVLDDAPCKPSNWMKKTWYD